MFGKKKLVFFGKKTVFYLLGKKLTEKYEQRKKKEGVGEGRAISPHVDAVALVRIEMCESERERERGYHKH